MAAPFTPSEVFDLETLLIHARGKARTLREAKPNEHVTRDHLGTLHVNAAALHRELGRLLTTLETKYNFRTSEP